MLCFDSGYNIPLKKRDILCFLENSKGWELNLFPNKNEKPGLASKHYSFSAAENRLSKYTGASSNRLDVMSTPDACRVLSNCWASGLPEVTEATVTPPFTGEDSEAQGVPLRS